MSGTAVIRLPPTRIDLAVARTIARHVTPRLEHAAEPLTWLADEKLVLAAAAAIWLHARLARRDRAARRAADRLLGAVIVAGALPHLGKRLIDRKRPDRTVVPFWRRGLLRSGDPWDSFPSGHALHLGAAAPMLRRLVPARLRPLVWPAVAALAATRMLLLAHYPSDVASGLLAGIAVDRGVGRLLGDRPAREPPVNSAARSDVAIPGTSQEKTSWRKQKDAAARSGASCMSTSGAS
jgi:undecaprenyl-diphosphatase